MRLSYVSFWSADCFHGFNNKVTVRLCFTLALKGVFQISDLRFPFSVS